MDPQLSPSRRFQVTVTALLAALRPAFRIPILLMRAEQHRGRRLRVIQVPPEAAPHTPTLPVITSTQPLAVNTSTHPQPIPIHFLAVNTLTQLQEPYRELNTLTPFPPPLQVTFLATQLI
jgi:hypothetical protein